MREFYMDNNMIRTFLSGMKEAYNKENEDKLVKVGFDDIFVKPFRLNWRATI